MIKSVAQQVFQNHPSIAQMHPKSTHAHPLAWDNKNISVFFNGKKNTFPSEPHSTKPNFEKHKRCYNSRPNLKFQSTQAKISSFKNSHIKIVDLLPKDQNHLSYYTLYNESEHNILAFAGLALLISNI